MPHTFHTYFVHVRYNMSNNVCYGAASAMEFNGGTQVYTHGNLFVQGGWTFCASPPGVGGPTHDLVVDAPRFYSGICGDRQCAALWAWNITNSTKAGSRPAIYTGDMNTIVRNSTGALPPLPHSDGDGWGDYFCGQNFSSWQALTKGDAHTTLVDGGGTDYTPTKVLAKAREMLWRQQRLT